jgi:hypothetical protein
MKPPRILAVVLLAAASFIAGYLVRLEPGAVNHERAGRIATVQSGTATDKSSNNDLASQGDQLTEDLKYAVEHFIQAADRSDTAKVAGMYDSRFINCRVSDAGEFVRLDRNQLLSFMERAAGPHFPTRSTTIHHVEVVGDTGFVLLTRIKDLGNGWEPMFYSLVWSRQDGDWRLLREYVHQRSLPKRQ